MAEILHKEGFSLTGSDIFESDTLQRIRAYGIPVYTEHKAENIKDAEAVVYTAAVKQDNPELAAAREKGIPTLERSVMLGIVCRRYADAVAVSGTHGKNHYHRHADSDFSAERQRPYGYHRRQAALFGRKQPCRQQRDHGVRGLRICGHFFTADAGGFHHFKY